MVKIEKNKSDFYAPPILNIPFFGDGQSRGLLVNVAFVYNYSNGFYEFNHPLFGLVQFDSPSEFKDYINKIQSIYKV